MDCLSAITSRFSARAFLDKAIERSVIESILKAARWAPSGVNTQPWRVVIAQKNLCQRIGDAIVAEREAGIPPNPDYAYYPAEWQEPYKSRRKACGLALYGALGIAKDDLEARKAQWYRNYYCFDAPIGLFFLIEARLEKGSWLDMGMFIQNIMLAAKGHGLDTCPEASLAEYPDIVRTHLKQDTRWHVVCGMAMGYADKSHPVNQYRTTREPLTQFAQFADD